MVFSLFALEDMKSKEISTQLNISSETVKWHLSEARKKLKSELIKINLSEKK
jgi:RNA polymerase sigma-70 factor (ECF subfamily)